MLDKEYRADSMHPSMGYFDARRKKYHFIVSEDDKEAVEILEHFVGVNEVRVNKMSGFMEATQYKRNGENARNAT
ncbi:hypothetical protein [Enterococcus faecalis]|uniref:hypothetical protein n=1 Tax=Enterococcus faecalis TaxID=1351 RepID=UPI003DA04AF6